MAFYPLRVNLVNAQASFANYFEYYTYERLYSKILATGRPITLIKSFFSLVL